MNDMIDENFEDVKRILKQQGNEEAEMFSKWTSKKAEYRYKTSVPNFPIYNNFIYWCDFGVNIGSEQNKLRPVIIVRTENKSPICTVIPLTSERINDKLWYHIDLENENSTVLVEQLRVISKIRIVNPYRRKGKLVSITKKDWECINAELRRLYQLREFKEK